MAETKVYTRRIELFNRTRNLIGQTRRNIHKASFFHRVLLPGTFVGREGCRVSIRRAIHISPLPISLWRALTTTRTIVIIIRIFIAFLILKKKKNHSFNDCRQASTLFLAVLHGHPRVPANAWCKFDGRCLKHQWKSSATFKRADHGGVIRKKREDIIYQCRVTRDDINGCCVVKLDLGYLLDDSMKGWSHTKHALYTECCSNQRVRWQDRWGRRGVDDKKHKTILLH